jgi:hypothetical protein
MSGLTSNTHQNGHNGMSLGTRREHEGLRVVALANSPRMMREALERALDGVPGILIVDLDGNPEKVEELAQQIQVNWLIVTLEQGTAVSRRVRRLLHRIPGLSLLAVSPEGDRVEVLIEEEGQIRRFTYWGVRLTSLIALLRSTVSGAEFAHPPLPPLDFPDSSIVKNCQDLTN